MARGTMTDEKRKRRITIYHFKRDTREIELTITMTTKPMTRARATELLLQELAKSATCVGMVGA